MPSTSRPGELAYGIRRGLTAAGTRIGPPKGADRQYLPPAITKMRLPPIETVTPSALPPANGESNEPEDEKNSSSYPQKMHCKSSTKENQDEQKSKNQYHATTSQLQNAPRRASI